MSNALCRWYHSYSLLPFKCPTSIKYNFNHVYIKSSALFHCKPVLKVSYPNQQNRRVGKVIISSKLFSQQNYSRNLSKSKRKQSKYPYSNYSRNLSKSKRKQSKYPYSKCNVVCATVEYPKAVEFEMWTSMFEIQSNLKVKEYFKCNSNVI